ncbi:alpha-2-macroglobulin [Parvularcula sp. LCG005]|uniref:alpha-2-macroglobulin family protein n=1 Tax=Parvularcula sp. LCG005 TaxID=3078805 RepID=UPI002942A57F|nr:alpha-2-macroglobulin [Parvularcula sp. LCG005]WOI53105.1 alpha-2-macroglobulin [Parvularcula sp. LCG005]
MTLASSRVGLVHSALLALGLFGGIAGCSDKSSERIETVPLESSLSTPDVADLATPSAGTPMEDASFRYLRYATNTDAATPEICLTFSAPLDPETDYSAYVDIETNVTFNVNGSHMCLGGMAYGDTAQLTLRKGFPAAGGASLLTPEIVTISFDDRPPMVAFAGDGVILPRVEADGLAIKTVNVDNVAIRIQRVNDRALAMRSVTSGFTAEEGEYAYAYGDDTPGQFGALVWEGEMTTKGPTNASVTTVVPLAEVIGTIEPGAYYVELADAKEQEGRRSKPVARAERWIIVTDLALTAYRGEQGLDLTVRSLQTAAPSGGQRVQLIAQSNEVLASKKSGRDGRVQFSSALMNGEGGNRPRLVLAYGENGDFAMLDLDRAPVDLSVHPVSGRSRPGPVDGYVYLDRGIYRPGETVHASLLLRDATDRAIQDRAGALVVYQPNGLALERSRFDSLPDAGGFAHSFEIPDTAARGSWRIAAEIDGAGTVYSTYFSVEDFVPQRVELTLTADTEKPILNGDPRMISARARFLYGAPGAGLIVDGTARVQRDPSPFKDWSGYQFGLHDEQFSEAFIELPAVAADGKGEASIPLSLGRRAADSTLPLRVRAVIEVEEPGGRTVADDIIVPYRPRDIYYGLKSDAGDNADIRKPVGFDVIAMSALGKLNAADVQWRLVRRDYDYDWYRSEGGSWQWRRSERIVPIESGVLSLDGSAPAHLETPPLDWGDYRLIISDNSGDVASQAFWVGWGGYAEDGVEAPDEVRVAGPKDGVALGGEARLAIRPPYAGLAEVVIATDRVIDVQHIEIRTEGAELSVPVTEAWGAGAYVMVTVYTPRDSATQPRPRRAVGVAYVPVNVDERTFEVSLETKDVIRPNQTLSIPIRAETGPRNETVYATLAAVDEGILLLTGFESPDPVDYFFGKEALGVDLYDDYGRLLDPNQGAAAPVRSGGDQIGGAGLTVVPTKTVAYFSGPVELGKDGRGTVKLDIPDFNGELRLMTVVWSDSGLGAGAKPMTVRDAVPAELVLPRFLSPGDTALATATLDNVEGKAGDYAVSITAEGPVTVNEGTLTMSLDQGQREDAPVSLTATAEGIAMLALSATGPDRFKASSEYPIEVRSAHWPETRVTKSGLAAGAEYVVPRDALSPFVAGSGLVQISFSATPVDTASLFASLYAYPYACTEQLTSRMFPLVYAAQLSSLAGKDGPEDARAEMQKTIETLLSRQSAEGAFGLWRVGDYGATPWLGAYATDFLTRAKEAGYEVPAASIDLALDALEPFADGQFYGGNGYKTSVANPKWTADTSARMQNRSAAYALYVLARNGRGDRSRLRYMHDELRTKIESPLALAQIGAGLAAMGDQGRARSAFEAAVKKVGYRNEGDWYQTPLRDRAGIVALAAEAGLSDIVEEMTPDLTRDILSADQLTTQEKAHLILAARAIAGDVDAPPVTYGNGGKGVTSRQFNDATLDDAKTFKNTSDNPVYVTLLTRGSPKAPPEAASQDLVIRKSFSTLTGQPVDLSQLAQGDRVVVTLRMEPARAALAQYMIVDLLPAGLEIEGILQSGDGGKEGAFSFVGDIAVPTMAEKRDDRFVAAIDTGRSAPVTLAYTARAVTAGRFTVPGAIAEDMYKPDVFARSAAGTMTIAP